MLNVEEETENSKYIALAPPDRKIGNDMEVWFLNFRSYFLN
jgi:hypothetical protein